jgi:hypothetical protein
MVLYPQGPPDNFAIMQAIFNAIPRDSDHNSVMWNSVDMDKTNVRTKAVYRVLQGFTLYLILTGKNYYFESRTEERWQAMLIVCNVNPSNFPNDIDGLHYKPLTNPLQSDAVEFLQRLDPQGRRGNAAQGNARRARGSGGGGANDADVSLNDVMDALEKNMEAGQLRRGVYTTDPNQKCRTKVCVYVCVCVWALFMSQHTTAGINPFTSQLLILPFMPVKTYIAPPVHYACRDLLRPPRIRRIGPLCCTLCNL